MKYKLHAKKPGWHYEINHLLWLISFFNIKLLTNDIKYYIK